MLKFTDVFKRLILPGFAFKAVVIGGGYATGRELVQFFIPAGPRGGILGILLTAAIWSGICALTFLFAFDVHSRDYRSFFRSLLGPFWILFEISYFLMVILILSVFGAAAGAIGANLFNLPVVVGALALSALIAGFATFGNDAVEELFKYVSMGLYSVYTLLTLLVFMNFSGRIAHALAQPQTIHGWVWGAVIYSAYNLVGAPVILPVTRHFKSRRDALIAGLLCGPFAALPALLFFLALIAFYPQIASATLPSDFILTRLNVTAFRYAYQAMIFAALLESGTGFVHAINERVAAVFARRRHMARIYRLWITLTVLTFSIFVAAKIGIVQLIAKGYTASAYVFLLVFLIPLLVLGLPRVMRLWGSPRREPVHLAEIAAISPPDRKRAGL
jgi:uncharacterized membrane protein YkvI